MNSITITREKNKKKIKKVLLSKRKSGSYLLNRYLHLVNKLNIVIPANTMVL